MRGNEQRDCWRKEDGADKRQDIWLPEKKALSLVGWNDEDAKFLPLSLFKDNI